MTSRRDGGPLALRAVFATWVVAFVALPVLALATAGLARGPGAAWRAVTTPAALDALWLSTWTGLLVAVLNALAGTAIAWILVRWRFPGRLALSWLVDLPFAIPTLVAGILVVALYGPQTWVGATLDGAGIPVVFARPGIVVVLALVTLPFVVRAVEPVLADLDPAEEEAAATLGASPGQTLRLVLLPPLLPAVAAGAVQVFARSVAEFGAVATVSGNLPHRTLTAPVYLLGLVESARTADAAAVSLVLLALAVSLQPLARWLAHRGSHRVA